MPSTQPMSQVWLNVYDTSLNNSWTRYLGFGKYHTGVEVFGKEYIYRVPDGVVDIIPRSGGIKTKAAKKPIKSILMGTTDKSRSQISNIISGLSVRYSARLYDPLTCNSNHFTEQLLLATCNKTIPQWINLVADLAGFCQMSPVFSAFKFAN